jgi:flavin reductase (DIM6/NTAB) family NADH-FMN oxidoreductase RutF
MNPRSQPASAEEPGMTSRWVADDGGTAGLALALKRAGECVAIVTAQGADGSLVGACCAASPALSDAGAPTLEWALPGEAPGLEVFTHAAHVALNFIAAKDGAGSAVVHRFTGPRNDKFAALAFEFGLGGAPLLERAVATFECENRPQIAVDAQGRRLFTGLVRRYRQTGWGAPTGVS